MTDPGVGDYARAFLAYTPAVLVFLALTFALLAWAPRLVALGWFLLAWVFLDGMFGAIFDLPDWIREVSPFHWASHAFAGDVDAGGVLALAGVTVALAALSFVGFRRRDVRTG